MTLGPIQNGFSTNLDQNPGTLPNVADVMLDWFQGMTFELVVKAVVNSILTETTTPLAFRGVIQPFKPQNLEIKSVGERDWSWYMLHSDINLALSTDDVVIYLGKQYRVMEKLDYTPYGYLEYHLILDYTGSGPST